MQQNAFSLAGVPRLVPMEEVLFALPIRVITSLSLCIALVGGCDRSTPGKAASAVPAAAPACGDAWDAASSLGNALSNVRSALVYVESNQQRAKLLQIDEVLLAEIEALPDSVSTNFAIKSLGAPSSLGSDIAFREVLRARVEQAHTRAEMDEVIKELSRRYGLALEHAASQMSPSHAAPCRRERWGKIHALLLDALGTK